MLNNPFIYFPCPSTPPVEDNITNPFDSGLMNRLSYPVCSPGSWFNESNTNREVEFEWSIFEMAHLRPVAIDTDSFQTEPRLDPVEEAEMQEKITKFFEENIIVPSPTKSREKKAVNLRRRRLYKDNSSPEQALEMNSESFNHQELYLHEDVYEKQLFPSEPLLPRTPRFESPIESPLQLSPLKMLKIESFSEEIMNRFSNCSLSPINLDDTISSAFSFDSETLTKSSSGSSEDSRMVPEREKVVFPKKSKAVVKISF